MTAGARYPHASTAARVHDHRMCRVIEVILGRVQAGAEPWGTPHPMPALTDEDTARATRARLFNARNCGQLAGTYGEISVSVMYAKPNGTLTNTRTPGEGGYVLVVRVFDRATGRRAIINRVANGEQLSYNSRRY